MTPAVALYGKIPSRGDFVRAGHPGALVQALDAWLQRGLMAHRGAPIEGSEPAVGFVFRSGDPRRALVGALRPSRDKYGRAFPLLLATETTVEGSATRISAEYGPFLLAAAACTAAVIADELAPEDAPGCVAATTAPLPTYAEFLQRTTLDGGGEGPGLSVPALLARLADVMRPHGALRYGLRLPLPYDKADRPLAAAFWLDAALRMGAPSSAPTLFWTASGSPASVVLFFGAPSPSALPYLLAGAASEAVYDLEGGTPPSALAPGGAPTLAALLHRL